MLIIGTLYWFSIRLNLVSAAGFRENFVLMTFFFFKKKKGIGKESRRVQITVYIANPVITLV